MLLYMYKQAACALIIIGRFFGGGKSFKGCTEVSSKICYTNCDTICYQKVK